MLSISSLIRADIYFYLSNHKSNIFAWEILNILFCQYLNKKQGLHLFFFFLHNFAFSAS